MAATVTRRSFLTTMASAGGAIALASTASKASAQNIQASCPPSGEAAPTVPADKVKSAPESADQPKDQLLNIALLQMDPHGKDRQKNLEKATKYCRWAKERGADIALMPEMYSIGYQAFHGNDPKDIQAWKDLAVPRDGEWVGHFEKLAKELDMAIAVTYLEKWDGDPRNTLTLIDRHGKQVLTYAKVHTCDFGFERATTPGTEWPVVELDTKQGPVKIGSMICYDREFPESARSLMLNGAEVVITPNACLLDDLRLAQFAVRALENSFCVAMTNYPCLKGRSVAYNGAGLQNVEAPADEGIYTALFNITRWRQYRSTSIWGDSFRRPQRYGLLTCPNHKLDIFKRKDAFGDDYDPTKR